MSFKRFTEKGAVVRISFGGEAEVSKSLRLEG